MIGPDVIASYLPYLRRYARALTGRQSSGDAHVRACLEALVADPAVMPDDPNPRIALFKLFHELWESTGRRLDGDEPPDSSETLAERIQALGSEQRQALLLMSMEEFTAEETARIMNRTPSEVQKLFQNAMDSMASAVPADVLVIEDESIIALDICAIIEGLGHRVVGVAKTRDQAVAAARKHRPGLVLADVHLADQSSGIDAVEAIVADHLVPVIFITAHPHLLLTGERPEPTFLIRKPFSQDEVKAAVSQALLMQAAGETV